jgi:autotransporter-associated beta strand protein/autotransporter passenger strand-loop-strand repeat protein
MEKKKNMKKIILTILTAITLTANSQAVVFLWNNTGTNWTSPTSWTNGIQPSATSSSTTTDEIQFGNFGANNNTVVLTSTRAAQNITFLANANPYIINSFNGAQTLSSRAGITNNSTATQTFNIVVENANNSNTWFQATGGTLVFNNVASLTTAASTSSRTLTLAGDGAFTFNNELKQGGTATAGIVKHIGAGTVTMNGTNTLAGGFEITGGGTVIVNGGTGVGQGLVTMSNGNSKLIVNSINGLSVLNSLKGSSSLANMSTVDLAGSNSVAVTTYAINQYQGGNMSFTNHGAGKTLLQFTNAANILTSSAATGGGRRLINNSANLTLQFDGTLDIGGTTADESTVGGVGDFLFKGSLLNTAAALRGLSKTGTGTAIFQAVNAYNGDTTIREGTFVVDTAGSIASSAAIVAGGTLRVKGLAGVATVNSGSLLVDSGGTVGATALVGGMLINSGRVGDTTVATGSTLDVRSGGTTSKATVNGGSLLIYGSVNQTVVNSGIATVFAGGNSGGSTINGSLLTVNGLAGDVLVNTGGTLGGSGSVQGLTLNGGTVAPGNSPGLLSAYELNGSNGTFQFQLGAPTTRGITYDAINITSALTLGANTNFTFETLDNYIYASGDSYDLFNFASIDATNFDITKLDIALPTLNSNELIWDTSSFTTDGLVSVVANVPEPSALQLFGIGLISLLACHRINKRNG